MLIGVLAAHLRERELVGAVAGDRDADQAARPLDHEVHRRGRDQLRRADQIALVLAILIVGDHDYPALAYVLNGLLDRAEAHGA